MSGSLVKRRSSIYDARIAGLYDLEETIGRGHYAVVKLAKHVFTGEKVAVKVIDKSKLDLTSKAHLMQEVTCMKLVQHPNIVRLYEVIDTQTKLFLILELADCDMFEYIMKYEKGIHEVEAQRYFCQIVEAIDYCHRLHVVHRDLKPENVVFFEDLHMVKLTDFGFSNLFTPGQQLETSCGSLAYSAPEILLGDAYDAPAVDVWSLGVILYMLVSGNLPFQEANDSETLTKILDCDFTLPSHLSQNCQSLIRLLLVRDPSKRATVNQVVDHPWVRAGNLGHAEVLPLISKEKVSHETHQLIIEQMAAGGISDNESIHRALEEDEYSHVTATYYLLAERILKKQRQEDAQRLLATDAKSDSQLEIASLALSPRVQEKTYDGLSAVCACPGAPEICSCRKPGEGGEDGLESLVSPVAKVPVGSLWSSSSGGDQPSSRRGSWRQRVCSIVKEESEEELDKYLQSPRPISPAVPTLPTSSRASQIAVLQSELITLAKYSSSSTTVTRTTGRRTPDRTLSRSPSPAGSTGSGRTSPVVGRFKAASGASLRKLSSSPHLRGICEEMEDESGLLGTGSGKEDNGGRRGPDDFTEPRSAMTYSSVRMIRPRQAVVSPDVIRRYERVYGSGSRSRRSTSCSSSEASDDDSERRYGLIASRHCRRDGSDQDDDSEPPVGGGRGGRKFRLGKLGLPPAAGNSNSTQAQENRVSSVNGGGKKHLDASKLIGKLQKLVLAPIREIPNTFFTSDNQTDGGVEEHEVGFTHLFKPKSCEHLLCDEASDVSPESTTHYGNSLAPPPVVPVSRNGQKEFERNISEETEDSCDGREEICGRGTEEEEELTGGEMTDDEAEDVPDPVLLGSGEEPNHCDNFNRLKGRKKRRHTASRRCRAPCGHLDSWPRASIEIPTS